MLNLLASRRFGGIFAILIAVAMALASIELPSGSAQEVSYSTSFSYSYSTERYITTSTVRQNQTAGPWFLVEGIVLADYQMASFNVRIRNLSNQRLLGVRLAVVYQFRNGTWTEPVVADLGDFEPGQSKTYVRSIPTDIGPDRPYPAMYLFHHIECSVRTQSVIVHTATSHVVFTFTSQPAVHTTQTAAATQTTGTTTNAATDATDMLAQYRNVYTVAAIVMTGILLVVMITAVRAPGAQKQCSRCGTLIAADSQYCDECGATQNSEEQK